MSTELKKIAGGDFKNQHGEPSHIVVDEFGDFYWVCPAYDDHDDEMDGPFETVEDAKDHAYSYWS